MDGPTSSSNPDPTADISELGLSLGRLDLTSHSSASLEPKYQYSPLDPSKKEIRVLRLRPGGRSDSITATIEHVSLLDDPYYETISYCWGDNPASVKIIVDGCLLLVPYSSAAVLRRLRHVQEERTLWIDAVCIDQGTITERGAQVAIMGVVFSMSKRTWIEFGDVDEGKAQAGKTAVKLVLQEAQAATNNFADLGQIVVKDKSVILSKQRLGDEIDMSALEATLSSPWFKRVWVMQEAALAQEAVCIYGEQTISLLDVVRAVVWLEHKRMWLPLSLRDTPGFSVGFVLWDYVDFEHGQYTPQDRNGSSVAGALELADELDSSEDKDRVFGVLGLMRCTRRAEGVSRLLAPDYTKSLLEVYRDATRYALAERAVGSNSLLNRIRHTAEDEIQHSDWLSWVPRWQMKWDQNADPVPIGRGFSAAKHRKQSRESILAPIDSNILSLGGMYVDEIRQCSLSLPKSADLEVTSRWIEHVQQLVEIHNQHDLPYVLLGGCNVDQQPATADDSAGFTDYMTFLRDGRFPPPIQELRQPEDDHVKRAAYFQQAFLWACWNRRFFVTLKGSLGIGPRVFKPGDVVVVLYGARSPFILRKWGEHWKILGEAYVHGIMYGEAMDEHEASGKPSETFGLC